MAKQIKKYGKTTLILGLILMLVAMYLTIPIGQAADLTKESDTITDSRPTTTPNHDIKFLMDAATTIAGTETVTVQFQGFTTGTTAIADADWQVLHDADGAGAYTALTLTTDYTIIEPAISTADPTVTFTFTSAGSTAIGTDKYMEIKLTNAANKLPNPSAGVYDIDIGGTFGDTGRAKVAIIAGVGVTATVSETLSFTIANVTAANCPDTIGGTDRSDEATHDADTVPFATITPETFYFSCQSLTIKTNAGNGYTATVQETDQLKYDTTEFPDGDCDGTCSEIAVQTWTGTTSDGFGYCMDDVTGNAALTTDASDDAGTGATDWVTANQCDDATPTFKIFPEKAVDSLDVGNVMKSYSAVDDTSYVGYRINAAYTQAAGAYSNTTIYVATPTY